MRTAFVVGHPAHVHLFRHAIGLLQRHGHSVLVVAVAKEATTQLLDAYAIPHFCLGRNYPALASKAIYVPVRDLQLLRILTDDKTDIVVSTGSPYAAQASAVRGIPHIAFSDTEVASLVIKLMMPFTDAVCTPNAYAGNLGPRHVRYNGTKELAYLHPDRYQPDPSVLDLVDARPNDQLIVVRFASWDSSHDLDERNLRSLSGTRLVHEVRELQRLGRVLLTSERQLPPELDELRIRIPVTRMHDLIHYSSLYIGEGATMAAEAGVLGTPWIFISGEGRGYLDEQQSEYALGFWEKSWDAALNRAREMLGRQDLKAEWQKRAARYVKDKSDVTGFISEFIEGWPGSLERARGRMANLTEHEKPSPLLR